MTDYTSIAHDYFQDGHNCAQAVFLPFARELMDEDLASRLSSPFGGGIGGMRSTCGALCGAFMAIGLFIGQEGVVKEVQDREREAVNRLMKDFVGEFGTSDCKALLAKDENLPEPSDGSRSCSKYVRYCASWIATEYRS